MRRTLVLVAIFSLFSLYLETAAQSRQALATGSDHRAATQQTVNLPLGKPTFRPKLSLQEALKIAEAYIDKEHIDISSYWLYQAHYILYGDTNTPDKDKTPCWHFWWVNDDNAMGHYVEIMITMDGKAGRATSM